jgi:hypothetical protein
VVAVVVALFVAVVVAQEAIVLQLLAKVQAAAHQQKHK